MRKIFRQSGIIGLSFWLIISLTQCDRNPKLVELNTVIPNVVLDIRYATENNFVGKVLYPSARCFLVRPAAQALAKVQQDLNSQGFKLIVFDGYRPLSVQKIMWKILPNPDYIADPATGSRHNSGYAVDVSLLDPEGNPVLMPTEYDDFTPKAHRDYQDLPSEAIRHRHILEETMVRHGFIPMPSEWWHFDYQGFEGRPILDVPIESLP